MSTGNLATSSRATSTTPKSPNSFHTGNACHTPRALGLSCARQHTHPHLLPSHAKPQIKKRQRHTTHTPVFLSFLSVCAYNSVTMSSSNRVKFLLDRPFVLSKRAASQVIIHVHGWFGWIPSIGVMHAHTHTHQTIQRSLSPIFGFIRPVF